MSDAIQVNEEPGLATRTAVFSIENRQGHSLMVVGGDVEGDRRSGEGMRSVWEPDRC